MSRNRFELVLSFLHLNNNEERAPDCDDRLFKVRPIIDHFLQKFCNMYTPHQDISIDEGMLSWRGRLGFRVYNPKKPVKYGIKSYVLTDSSNGYCWNLKPYCGVGATLEETILTLLGDLLHCGHNLFMDNFHNSFQLSKKLLRLGTHTCGTLRRDRGAPAVVNDASNGNMKVGDVVASHKDNVMCLAWRDKRVVRMISTIGENKMVEVRVRKRGVPNDVQKDKPHCIVLYNASMGGVDKMDQCIKYYPFTRKSVKWTKKFAFYLIQIAMFNAYIIYTDNVSQRKCKSLYEFILSVIRSFITCRPTVEVDSDQDSEPSFFGRNGNPPGCSV